MKCSECPYYYGEGFNKPSCKFRADATFAAAPCEDDDTDRIEYRYTVGRADSDDLFDTDSWDRANDEYNGLLANGCTDPYIKDNKYGVIFIRGEWV